MSFQDSKTKTFEWHTDQLDDKNFQIRGKTIFFIIVLFSIVLVITLLFFYARWLCRSPTRSAATSSAHVAPPVNRGLDPATIDSFPTTAHRPSASGAAECCICLGVFEDGEKVKVLPSCNHYYHPECVDRWLLTQSSCPICRASLRVDDKDSPVVDDNDSPV